jgi:electron transfer flavoprotein alpha subunit
MSGLRTVVLVKQVPAGEHDGGLDARGRLRRDGDAAEMNPWCRRAVTRAVELAAGGGHSTAVTMGPASAGDVLREALACGVDAAVHVTDRRLAGADCLVTARVLAAAIRQVGGADVVLVGHSSVDGSTGAVGPMVAELLAVPFGGPVLDLRPAEDVPWLRAELQLENGREDVTVALPAVLAVAERSCRAARAAVEDWPEHGNLTTVTAGQLGCGVSGADSPTRVTGVVEVPRTRRGEVLGGHLATQIGALVDALRQQRDPEPPEPVRPAARLSWSDGPRIVVLARNGDDVGTRALFAEADRLAARIRGHVAAVLGGGRAPREAAPCVELGGTEPRRVAAAVAQWLGTAGTPPWAVLGGASEWEREVLSRLGARLGTGLLSDLTGLSVGVGSGEVPRLRGVKPAGSGALAQVECLGLPQLATVRTGQLPAPVALTPGGPGELLPVSADARVRRPGGRGAGGRRRPPPGRLPGAGRAAFPAGGAVRGDPEGDRRRAASARPPGRRHRARHRAALLSGTRCVRESLPHGRGGASRDADRGQPRPLRPDLRAGRSRHRRGLAAPRPVARPRVRPA